MRMHEKSGIEDITQYSTGKLEVLCQGYIWQYSTGKHITQCSTEKLEVFYQGHTWQYSTGIPITQYSTGKLEMLLSGTYLTIFHRQTYQTIFYRQTGNAFARDISDVPKAGSRSTGKNRCSLSAQKRHHGRDADPPTLAAQQRGQSDDHHQLPGSPGAGAGVLRERVPGAATAGSLRLLHSGDGGPSLPHSPARRSGVCALVR